MFKSLKAIYAPTLLGSPVDLLPVDLPCTRVLICPNKSTGIKSEHGYKSNLKNTFYFFLAILHMAQFLLIIHDKQAGSCTHLFNLLMRCLSLCRASLYALHLKINKASFADKSFGRLALYERAIFLIPPIVRVIRK